MVRTEVQLWKKIREVWPGHAVRIEASLGGCDPGTPDTNVSVDGRGGWIELKVWPEELRASQLAWHIDALQRGAYAVVMCAVESGVWLGTAEAYSRLRKKPDAVDLQTALNVVVLALIGRDAVQEQRLRVKSKK